MCLRCEKTWHLNVKPREEQLVTTSGNVPAEVLCVPHCSESLGSISELVSFGINVSTGDQTQVHVTNISAVETEFTAPREPVRSSYTPHTYVITPLFHPQFINAMCILLNHSVLRTMGKLLSNLPSTPKSEAIIRRLELSTRAWHATRVLTRPKLFDQEAFCSCVLDEVVPLLSLTTGP